MRLDLSQQMRMDQRMVLAPRMIQSMEILQLSILALQERIEQELLSNPTLELEEPAPSEQSANPDSPRLDELPQGERILSLGDGTNNRAQDFARLEDQDDGYTDYMNRADYVRRSVDEGASDRKLEAMQNTAAPDQTLNEYLHDQWILVECDPVIDTIGRAIIDLINDEGYLPVELEKVRDFLQQPASEDQLEEALALVQSLDPPGVGARDLTECMLLQLLELDEADLTIERELILGYLKDLEGNRFPLVAKKTGHSMAAILKAVKTISRLDPRPGLRYSARPANYIVPDIIVELDEETGQYTARLAEDNMPSLRLSADYATMARNRQLDSKTRDFLKNNIQSARWLIESIQQRKHTLLSIVLHVLHTQRDFFTRGAQALKPLPMVEVAAHLGIHVTTVSRAVSGKYMQTPAGIFPLKFFFSGGTANADGDAVSWDAIKAKLNDIVQNEDKKKPFNDDELVEELKKAGLEVARRTVAKYRGVLNIPTARHRRLFV